jgi:hypothetical protein
MSSRVVSTAARDIDPTIDEEITNNAAMLVTDSGSSVSQKNRIGPAPSIRGLDQFLDRHENWRNSSPRGGRVIKGRITA